MVSRLGVTARWTMVSRLGGPWCHGSENHGVTALRTMVSRLLVPWCHGSWYHGVTATCTAWPRLPALHGLDYPQCMAWTTRTAWPSLSYMAKPQFHGPRSWFMSIS